MVKTNHTELPMHGVSGWRRAGGITRGGAGSRTRRDEGARDSVDAKGNPGAELRSEDKSPA